MVETVALRWGHRPRDFRVTTHVVLTARAFGASSVILSDTQDATLRETVERLSSAWGGRFSLKMGIPWRNAVEEWRRSGGIIVHLTMYGENIETSKVIERIRSSRRKIMILVGSQKVPGAFFDLADFNVAIGTQPHSEIAALAVFLDRFYRGKQLQRRFSKARIRVKPSRRGKNLITIEAGTATSARKSL
ncbi:MAG: tRNA (cytidine(56)-2'-O)-methyltransferase [archaeon]